MRTTTLSLLAVAALALAPRLAAEPQPIEVRAVPVALDEGDARAERIGRLRYRAGFHLTSEHPGFGGFSGLVIAGGHLVAVSDEGRWLSAELRLAADGTLEGLGEGRLGTLCDDDGAPVAGKERTDAEELQALPGRGLLVSFEHHHRLALYADSANGQPPLAGRPQPFSFPPAIAATRANKGMEAVAVLADGRLLTFAEDLRTIEDDILGWIGDPHRNDWQPLTLETRDEFLPTGAATLPSGDVILLERSYSKTTDVNRVRLSLLSAADLVPGARLRPAELARLEPPSTVDNMEAVAVHSGPGEEVLVYLLSDDNFNAEKGQRTLLMQFELLDESP